MIRILLVEDDERQLTRIKQILEKAFPSYEIHAFFPNVPRDDIQKKTRQQFIVPNSMEKYSIDMELTVGDWFVAEVRQVITPTDVIPVGRSVESF